MKLVKKIIDILWLMQKKTTRFIINLQAKKVTQSSKVVASTAIGEEIA